MSALDGKVALVTGGNGGLGLAMARALQEDGATVAIVGRRADKLERALASLGPRASGHRVDLDDLDRLPALVDDVVRIHGGLDVLVNNAGMSVRGPPHELDIDDYERVMRVNGTAGLRLAQLAYPHLRAGGAGRVVFIGSMFSNLGSPFSLPYAVSKGAVLQLTRSLAVAWAPDGIRVNCILPGWFDTELTRGTREQLPDLEQQIRVRAPVGRWGRPSDLAGAVVFLAGPGSEFVTGASIPVDGGFMAAM